MKRRHKYALAALLIYWPMLFIITHLPVKIIATYLHNAKMSDYVMHYLAYLILAFFWWFAIRPYKKVDWRKIPVWLSLALLAWYSAIDEWLQMYVGRSPQLHDFLADFAGVLTSLIILSLLSFWPAALVIFSVFVFGVTNLSRANMVASDPNLNAAFHFCAYAFVAILWIQIMDRFLRIYHTFTGWFIVSLLLPCGFLAVVKVCSVLLGKSVYMIDIFTALTGILAVVILSGITGIFRHTDWRGENSNQPA